MPPIGSWLLTSTEMEKHKLSEGARKELEAWNEAEGAKELGEQQWQRGCGCFLMVPQPELAGVWKGHVCNTDVRKPFAPSVVTQGTCVQSGGGGGVVVARATSG